MISTVHLMIMSDDISDPIVEDVRLCRHMSDDVRCSTAAAKP